MALAWTTPDSARADVLEQGVRMKIADVAVTLGAAGADAVGIRAAFDASGGVESVGVAFVFVPFAEQDGKERVAVHGVGCGEMGGFEEGGRDVDVFDEGV